MSLIDSAKAILKSSMGVKPNENVLVVTDDTRIEIGKALYQGAKELGCESMLMIMGERQLAGEEPPKTVAQAMKAADVVVCPTAKSLTHTNARIEAAKAGARIATMPGITEDMFSEGAVTADYKKVAELTKKVTAMLTKANTACIKKDSCVLTIDLTGRKGVESSGVYLNPGESGNLPSGEGYIAPLENGSNGKMIIDGSMVGIGKLNTPLKVTLKDGKLTKIEGKDADKLGRLLATKENSTLCELGIGTNEKARLIGNILEDEKVYGTVHIAFGTNTSFGGTNKAELHMDGIILKPTLYLDEQLVIKDGVFIPQ